MHNIYIYTSIYVPSFWLILQNPRYQQTTLQISAVPPSIVASLRALVSESLACAPWLLELPTAKVSAKEVKHEPFQAFLWL